MPPVRSIKNQYRGINAHLHSFWQGAHKWNRFHNVHITTLMQMLKAQLLPMGYTAEIEESLQIRRVGDDLPHRPRPDVLIRDLEPHRVGQPTGVSIQPVPLKELVEEEEDVEHPYFAVLISEYPGEAVAWVELLSPANKGDSKDAYTYLAKRRLLLEKGLVLVEIDYLHETPPTFERLPDYSQRETGAYPYRIAVIDPRPEYQTAQVYPHQFGVDAPIPKVDIPLNAGDVLLFDFGAAYRKTFEDALYGYDMDYSQLPLNFDRYSTADQARTAARMLAVLKAVRDGVDVEANAPLPAESVTLEDAMAKLGSWG